MSQVRTPPVTAHSMSSADSGAISSLMAMAEYMLCQKPQRIAESVRCLLALLTYSPPPRVEARVRLQLGLILYHHTNNLLEARQSLEQAMLLSGNIPGMEEVKFEAASVLARIHINQGHSSNARKVLRSVMDISSGYPYWHCRLLLQKASVYVKERDFDSLVVILTQASSYASQIKAPCTRSLCLIAKGVHLLVNRKYQDGANTLSEACSLIEDTSGPKQTLHRAFYRIVQVTHLLNAGLIKTAKPHIKQLQQCVKLLSSEEIHKSSHDTLTGESFEWLSREQTYVLAYLICIMHSVLAGNVDKALNYTGKAIKLIEGSQARHPVMITFQAHLLENIIVCLLMQGKVTLAGSTLQEVIGICHSHSSLVYSHRAVLHTLLGLYSFSIDCLDNSISQFLTALQHTNNSELKIFINMNLAICYIKLDTNDKDKEIRAIMDSFESESQTLSNSKNLKGAISYLRGLYAYKQVKLHEAKRQLRESLAISNNNDLSKLTVCSLLLLGKIFLSLGNNQETQDMVGPAFHLSSKIQDKRLQVWAAALSAELHHSTGNVTEEGKCNEKIINLNEKLQEEIKVAKSASYHSLTMWTVGDWPIVKALPTPSVTEDTRSGNEGVWPETRHKSDENVINEHLPETKGHDSVMMQDISGSGEHATTDATAAAVASDMKIMDTNSGDCNRGKHNIKQQIDDTDDRYDDEAVLPEKKIKLSSDISQDDNISSSLVKDKDQQVYRQPHHIPRIPSLTPSTEPLTPLSDTTTATRHNTSSVSPITTNSVQTSPFMPETKLHPSPGNLPTYNESMIHKKSPIQSHTPLTAQKHHHPAMQPQPSPASSAVSPPSHLELYRQQQRNIRHQLEALKQRQVLFHQAGSATPQEWHQLQVQQQHLLQKKNIIDKQIQQLLMREEQMKIHQQNQQMQQEMERAQRMGHNTVRKEQQEQIRGQQLSQHHTEGGSHSPSLWKPITKTSPHLFQSSPPAGAGSRGGSSFMPTPPFSSQETQHTPPSNIQSPSPHHQHNVSLSKLMKGPSPTAVSIGSSPDVQSGFNTPKSIDQTHIDKTTPIQHHHQGSTHKVRNLPEHQPPQAMIPPQYQQLQHHQHLLMHNQGEHQTQEALLRQQEHQRRLMIQQQQQQQMLQHQLRQSQHDPATLYFQHGMVPLANYHQHQLPSDHRSIMGRHSHEALPQQHGVSRQPPRGHHGEGAIGGYPTEQYLPYGKRN